MSEQMSETSPSPESTTPLDVEGFRNRYLDRLKTFSAQERELHMNMRHKLEGKLPEEFRDMAIKETIYGTALWAISMPLYLIGGVPGFVTDIIGSLGYEAGRMTDVLKDTKRLDAFDWIAGTLLPFVNPPLIRGARDLWTAYKAFDEIAQAKKPTIAPIQA